MTKMGIFLSDPDEGIHPPGTQINWNESRYVDFWDAEQRVGGWFRIGNRPNAGYAEMTATVNLPDGRIAFMFDRPKIEGNTLKSGNQSWEIVKPWITNRVSYQGDLFILEEPWQLTEPKAVFKTAKRVPANIDLTCTSSGLHHVMGFDQSHIERIFLPGQADFHYQHLAHTMGTVQVGNCKWDVAGHGGKDHSWGPRNWLAKLYFRWLSCGIDQGNGFMLTRGVGPDKQTRGGFVLENGEFHLVDDFQINNLYGPAPNFELKKVQLNIGSGERTWQAVGLPQSWLPLRHKQPSEEGEATILRIVKSPTEWQFAGRKGEGMCEYHDIIADGRPIGLQD